MPSGAKKRKAAKKKKEAAKTNSAAQPRGNDDPKSQDEGQSDGGEVSSPAPQNLKNHHNPFNKGEGADKNDISSVRSIVSENKSVEGNCDVGEGTQKRVATDDGGIKNVRELKPDKNSEGQITSNLQMESMEDSQDGDSSSNSSDDEAGGEKNSVVAESLKLKEEAFNMVSKIAPVEVLVKLALPEEVIRSPEGKDSNSLAKSIPAVDSSKPVVSSSEEVVHVTKNVPVDNSVNTDAAKSKDNMEKSLPPLDKKTGSSSATDLVSQKDEAKVFPLLDNSGTSSSTMASASLKNKDKPLQSSNAPGVETRNEDKVFPLSENSATSSGAMGFASKEYEKKMMGSSSKENEKKLLQSLNALSVETRNDDKVFPLPENSGASSRAMGFSSKENENKLSQFSNAPSIETRNGTERIKDSEFPECSENQPLVASVPRTVEKASWKSCCGLFEVLTGSNR